MTTAKGNLYILCATVLSLLLSVNAGGGQEGIEKTVYLIWPPFLGVLSIVVFLIVCWISKKTVARKITVSFLCIYIVYVGLGLHFGKGHWPLVIW